VETAVKEGRAGEGTAKLEVENLTLNFGKIKALDDVSLELREGEILGLIGPNGAGKTCILNCINGFYRPQKGNVYFKGQNITKLSRYKIAQLGISRTFQNIQLYTGLSTVDNLMAARHNQIKYNFVVAGIYFGRALNEEVKHRGLVENIIDFLDMKPIRSRVVESLPYGQRKKVDLGRALVLEPDVLLLDEPMAGMNVEEKEDMARYIIDIHELWDIPILLVEHDMGVVMDIVDRVVVLDFGRKIAEGKPQEIRNNDKVIKAYLGTEAA
jgi:branched-chain amino acid transport system ATP-binding protein